MTARNWLKHAGVAEFYNDIALQLALTLIQSLPLFMTALKHTAIRFSLLLIPLLLAACATSPQKPQSVAPTQAHVGAEQAGQAEEKPPVLPNVELNDDLLYGFLVGEVAMQRGQPGLSVQTYLDLARTTRDPRVARRAAQLAIESRQMDKATEAFQLWLELDPGSQSARQMLISLLVSRGKLEDARPLLAQSLAAEPENVGEIFRQIYPLLARHAAPEAVWKLLHDLAQPYPKVAEAHWAVAQAAAAAGKHDEALAEVQQARTLRPEWDEAVLLEVQLLRTDQPQQALAVLKDFLASHAEAAEVRLLYARLLLEQKQYQESRVQFQKLLDAHPDNADLAFAVALLSLQLGELDRAEKELQQALVHGKKDQDTVHYYFGQLEEAKKNTAAALQQYRKVTGGEYLYPARLREAFLLSTSGKLNEARALLHSIPAQNSQQQVQLLLIEAQLLRDAKQFDTGYQVLQQGLAKFPDDPDLLYEAALLADKIGKPDVLEKLMRKLIQIQPDNANAYNALGYSFLERNVRVDEGMQLVEKAYQLEPGDAAIIDSMGWGHYRQGKLDKSLEFLRRAFSANPDPEIAAHLGEVLWVHGNRDEAKKVWSGSLKQHPKNELLQAVMKKFLQ